MNSLEYIIRNRIKDYKADLDYCIEENKNYEQPKDLDRIKQDKAIIQELEKILYGKDLNKLSYVD